MDRKISKNAQQIKAQLIDFILEKYNGIIATEVPVEEKKNIIDVMFIGTEVLIGFEIKSDYDTNVRLEKQLESYCGTFNQLYIVCGEDFYKKNSSIKKGIGIIISDGTGLRLKRKASHRKFPAKKKMVNFLWKADLPYTYLKGQMGVGELKQKATREIATKELFMMAIRALTNRYQPRFDSFMKARGEITFVQDVDVLTIQDRYL